MTDNKTSLTAAIEAVHKCLNECERLIQTGENPSLSREVRRSAIGRATEILMVLCSISHRTACLIGRTEESYKLLDRDSQPAPGGGLN